MAGSDVNWKIKISIIVEIKNLKWGGSIRPKPDNQLIFGLMVKFGPLVFYLFGRLDSVVGPNPFYDGDNIVKILNLPNSE